MVVQWQKNPLANARDVYWIPQLGRFPGAGNGNPLQYFFFIYFISWRLITLQYCSVFVIHWHESAMDLYVFPILIPQPTSLSILFLWVFPVHQAQGLVSFIQPVWRSVSPLIVYLFQCCSLKTSHPRFLPQSPKFCSIHLCLFFCFAYRVSLPSF